MKLFLCGIDPSLKRTGVSFVVGNNIIIKKYHSDEGCTYFEQVLERVREIEDCLIHDLETIYKENNVSPCKVITETPPPMGQFSAGLYGLDVHLILSLLSTVFVSTVIAVNPTYVGHLHGTRKYTKTESVKLAEKVLSVLEEFGFQVKIEGRLCHDMAESLLMLTRLIYLENLPGLNERIVELIPNIKNDKGYKFR